MQLAAADLFFVLLIFQLLFISLFLFTYSKGKKISLRLLGAFFLSFCLSLLDSFLLLQQVYFSRPAVALWGAGLPLLYGPLLWLYTRSVLQPDFRFSVKSALHFLPFVLVSFVSLLRYQQLTAAQQQALLTQVLQRNLPNYVNLVALFIYLHFFAYAVLCLQQVTRTQQQALQQFSDAQRTNLHWLRNSLLFFTALMVLGAASSFIVFTPWAHYYYLLLTLLVAAFFIYMTQVLLKALRHPHLFSSDSLEAEPVKNELAGRAPAAALPVAEQQRIKAQLTQFMQTEKPYRQSDLSLEQLARALFLRPRVLSQVLNEHIGQSFFDFVNTYRIEEAKQLLAHPKDPKVTVLEVLYEVGFNSKSSFNTLFKKHTGLTPTEFKRRHAAPNVRLSDG